MPALMNKFVLCLPVSICHSAGRLRWQLLKMPLAAILVLGLLATPATAAGTYSWTGGGGNTSWSTTANWAGGTAPSGSTNTLVFSGSTVTSNTNTIPSLSLSSLSFAAGASAFTLSGSNIALNAGTISSTSSNLQTINLGIDLQGANTVSGAVGRNIVLGGALTGTGSLTKSGSNTVTLSGSNTFSGLTTVGVGTLAFGSNNALSSDVTLNGGELALGGFTGNVGAVILNSGAITGSGGSLTGSSYTLKSGSVSAVLSGTGSLSKTTTGTVILSGSNTYSGLTTVSAGTLAYGTSNAIGSGNVTISGGGELALGSYSDTVGSVTLTSGTISGSGTLTGSDYTLISGLVSASLAGSGTMVKNQTSTVTLTGSNSFTGDFTINTGIVNIQNSSALGSASGTTTVTSGATLQLQGGITLSAEPLAIRGQGASGSSGALQNVSGTNTISGPINQIVASRINSDAGLLRITNNSISGTGLLTIGGAGDTLISSTIATSTGLTKDGSGTLTLSGSNTYTGLTAVAEGKLLYGTSNAIATGGVTVGTGSTSGIFSTGSYSDSIGAFTLTSGTLAMAANATSQAQLISTNVISLGSTNTLDLAGSGTTAGLYKLLAGTSVTGSFGTVSNLNNAYSLLQSGSTLDLQQKGVIGTITATPSAVSIITGGSTAFAYTVANANATGGATLSFSGTGLSNVVGSSSGTAAAASTSGSIAGLTFNGTGTGANQAGTFTVSDPNAYPTSATGTVNVNVYGHSSPTLTSGTISVGNVHVGYGATTSLVGLSATNAAGYRVDMSGSAPASGNVSLSSLSAVAAGTSATINATLAAGGTAGAVSQNLIYTFRDDSSLSGASANTGTAAITVVGGIYNLAAANPITTPITLTNIHVGGTFGTSALTISNTAPAGSYTEGLNAGFGTGIGSVSTNSGTFSNLAAGSTNSSSLAIGLGGSSNSGTAGVVTGTQAILLVSSGSNSGLANTSLATQSVAVSGTVFNLAAANTITTPITLTNIRVGGTFGTSALTISNTAPGGSYTEGLNAAFGSSTGAASTNSGTFSNLAAGQTNSSSLVVGLGGSSNTSLAGLVSGTQAISLVSNGTVSGLADTSLTTQNVAISGGVYNYANAAYTGTTVAFGNVHQGASGVSQNVAFGNQTVTSASYQDLLNVSGTTTNSLVTANGFTGLAASTSGSTTNNLGLSANTGTLGSLASTVNLTLVSNANGVSGLSDGVATVVGSPTAITTTGNVYSGQSTWATNGSGSWGTLNSSFGTNWGANQGSPGLDAGFTNTDTATFGSATTSGTAVVSLDGAAPSLRAITFSNTNASYNIAQGTGTGSLTLSGSGGAATVNVAGNQSISVPLTLGTSVNIDVAAGSQLTVNGAISGTSGSALSLTGSGKTIFTGTSTYTGNTNVNAGELLLAGALGNTAVSVGSGATLAGNGSILGDVTVSNGGTINPGTGPYDAAGPASYATLTVGDLSLGGAASTATTLMDIRGDGTGAGTAGINYDQIAAHDITYGGDLVLNFWTTESFAAWTVFDLFKFTGVATEHFASVKIGTGEVGNVYAGLSFVYRADGEWIADGGSDKPTLTFSEKTGDLTVALVPEPSTLLIAGIGVAMTFYQARRKAARRRQRVQANAGVAGVSA